MLTPQPEGVVLQFLDIYYVEGFKNSSPLQKLQNFPEVQIGVLYC